MTIPAEVLFSIGLLDVILLLVAYVTYRRILNLQKEYEKGAGI
jgi:hypothetical protein